MGDPAGIGGELTLKAWQALRASGPVFAVLDDPERLQGLAAALGLAVSIRAIRDIREASGVFGEALPVLPVALETAPVPGRPDPANAAAVILSIERAVALVRDGKAGAVVTNPSAKRPCMRRVSRTPVTPSSSPP
jgi:4-hydroxythreonine-4-phosphate dehydrogenase